MLLKDEGSPTSLRSIIFPYRNKHQVWENPHFLKFLHFLPFSSVSAHAQTTTPVEAIMWHGYNKNSDAYFATQNFYKLSKTERDAVVAFIKAI